MTKEEFELLGGFVQTVKQQVHDLDKMLSRIHLTAHRECPAVGEESGWVRREPAPCNYSVSISPLKTTSPAPAKRSVSSPNVNLDTMMSPETNTGLGSLSSLPGS